MKYPKYPKYKDSGIEWIGEIPKHWKIEKIKFVADVIMGQSPPSETYTENGIIPFLQGCAEFGKLSPIPTHYCDIASKLSLPGDILFSVRAPVGEMNISDVTYGIGRGLCSIRASNFDSHYLFWALHAAKTQLFSISRGSTYDAISADDIRNLAIGFPTTGEEVELISSFLNSMVLKLDLIIATQQQLIEILKEKRQAIITHAVTKGLDPNVPMKDFY